MSLTVLFDLDDTLLGNNIDDFLPVYLRALGKHTAAYLPPEKFARELLAATGVMLANDTPARTLEAAFNSAFYPAIGFDVEWMRPVLEEFYATAYGGLRAVTRQIDSAPEVVRQVKAAGHTLVVATNPLFPASAIRQRIEWAGLNPDDFALITTYERMHYAKPNPAYVAEILAQLGWPDRPAVMIGNSLQDDLLPAALLGLPVYWVTTPGAHDPALTPYAAALEAGLPEISGAGELAGVPEWLAQVQHAPAGTVSALPTPAVDDAATSARAPVTTAPVIQPLALLATLKASAAAIDTLASGLRPEQWHSRANDEDWSAVEIVQHLCDVEREVNLPRMETLLRENDPFIVGVDADRWATERGYAQREPLPALRGFLAARAALIGLLQAMPPEGWQRTARHAIFGPTTLRELASFIATHDRVHIQQLRAVAR